MDAIQLLTNDHDIVRSLFHAINNAGEHAVSRKELFAQLAGSLRVHARIEEEIFYPRAKTSGREDDGEGGDLVTEAAKEHREIDYLLREIEALDASTRQWVRRVKKLERRVEHHAGEEESDMFPRVRAQVAAEELSALGAQLAARKEQLSPRSPDAVPPLPSGVRAAG